MDAVGPAAVRNNILLVDDDADVLDALGDLIGLVWKRPVHTARGLVEVERLSGELGTFALALVDVNLGAGRPSGLDVFRWLRSRHFVGRIVFLTGHAADSALLHQVRATGAEMFSKPIDVDALRALIASN